MTRDETTQTFRALLERPYGVHILTTMFLGKTADCLREHGIEPTDDKRENARLHLQLHRGLNPD